jgi:hypothetical protein
MSSFSLDVMNLHKCHLFLESFADFFILASQFPTQLRSQMEVIHLWILQCLFLSYVLQLPVFLSAFLLVYPSA